MVFGRGLRSFAVPWAGLGQIWRFSIALSGSLGGIFKFRIVLRVGFEVFCRPVSSSGEGLGADFEVRNRLIGDLGWNFWVPNRFASRGSTIEPTHSRKIQKNIKKVGRLEASLGAKNEHSVWEVCKFQPLQGLPKNMTLGGGRISSDLAKSRRLWGVGGVARARGGGFSED